MTSLLHGLSTARLELGPLTAADEPPLAQAIDWDHAEAPLTGWTHARLPELFDAADPSRSSAGLRRGPTLVGAVLTVARGRTLEVDGIVLPAWRGVGYAGEVLGAIVDLAFAGADPQAPGPRFDEVRLTVSGGNLAAIRAARAVGLAATPIAGPRRPDGFRGDRVILTGGPALVRRQRVSVDAAYVERLIATLGAFEARMLVDRNQARAGREYPPLRRHPHALDELAAILAKPGADYEAARHACGPFGMVDKAALARAAAGLGEGQIAELQKIVRTSHSSATEYAEAMSADALLHRIRRASPP